MFYRAASEWEPLPGPSRAYAPLHCRAAWAGSLVALAGTLIIAGDSGGGGGEAAGAAAGAQAALLPLGDLLTLAAALCYSAATVRIPAWTARRAVTPLQLALGKAAFLAAASSAALGWQAAQLAAEGQSVASLWPGWQQPEGWALVFWAAVGPGALASVLQAKVRRGGCESNALPCLRLCLGS